MEDKLIIADKVFSSRLFTGTGKFGDHRVMEDALLASGTELVTVALKLILPEFVPVLNTEFAL